MAVSTAASISSFLSYPLTAIIEGGLGIYGKWAWHSHSRAVVQQLTNAVEGQIEKSGAAARSEIIKTGDTARQTFKSFGESVGSWNKPVFKMVVAGSSLYLITLCGMPMQRELCSATSSQYAACNITTATLTLFFVATCGILLNTAAKGLEKTSPPHSIQERHQKPALTHTAPLALPASQPPKQVLKAPMKPIGLSEMSPQSKPSGMMGRPQNKISDQKKISRHTQLAEKKPTAFYKKIAFSGAHNAEKIAR